MKTDHALKCMKLFIVLTSIEKGSSIDKKFQYFCESYFNNPHDGSVSLGTAWGSFFLSSYCISFTYSKDHAIQYIH